MGINGARKRLVVVGDGIVGASIAAAAVVRGASVVVVGTGPTEGSSWRSFGWLGAAQEVPRDYHRLRLLSLGRYREIAMRNPYSSVIHFSGSLTWDLPGKTAQLIQGADEIEAVADTFQRLRSTGHSVHSIGKDEAVRLEPALSLDAMPQNGILYAADEGWVDLPALTGLLLADAVSKGASLVIDKGAKVSLESGRAAVRLNDGTSVIGDEVIVAAGHHTPAILKEGGLVLPHRSTKGALLLTEPSSLQLRMLVRTPVGSLRPRPGGGAVVHTSRVESALTSVDEGRFVVNEESVSYALDELGSLFSEGAKLRLDRVLTGLRPIPGDGWSVAGPVDDIEGLWVAFTHSGATLGPILGEILATEIIDEEFRSPLLSSFRPNRFVLGG